MPTMPAPARTPTAAFSPVDEAASLVCEAAADKTTRGQAGVLDLENVFNMTSASKMHNL